MDVKVEEDLIVAMLLLVLAMGSIDVAVVALYDATRAPPAGAAMGAPLGGGGPLGSERRILRFSRFEFF